MTGPTVDIHVDNPDADIVSAFPCLSALFVEKSASFDKHLRMAPHTPGVLRLASNKPVARWS